VIHQTPLRAYPDAPVHPPIAAAQRYATHEDSAATACPTVPCGGCRIRRLPRRDVVWMDVGLHAIDAEFAIAEVEHHGDRRGRDALPMVHEIDDVSDRHPLTADMAVMTVDHARVTVGLSICHGPEPVADGMRSMNLHGARGLDPLCVDRRFQRRMGSGLAKPLIQRVCSSLRNRRRCRRRLGSIGRGMDLFATCGLVINSQNLPHSCLPRDAPLSPLMLPARTAAPLYQESQKTPQLDLDLAPKAKMRNVVS
jgi:hypothetical protein